MPFSSCIAEFCFADNAEIMALTKIATAELNKVMRARELNISVTKTKFFVLGRM